jgi:hypothetical protein
MKKSLFWTLAIVITLASAVYQRVSGPTYPVRIKADVAGSEVRLRLPRSAETTGDLKIALDVPAPIEGYLEYKRFKVDEPWVKVPLVRQEGDLVGFLPKQPAAGKLAYRVFLTSGDETVSVTGEKPVVIRFKDPVPLGLLITHILVMFAGMLAATAAGLAALDKKRNPRRFVLAALALLFVGGFILGPLVQKAAFGVYWSGFPKGFDLTDNKTLISFIFWIIAAAAGRKGRPARPLVILASLVTLLIFLIPHSLFGSELDYTKMR